MYLSRRFSSRAVHVGSSGFGKALFLILSSPKLIMHTMKQRPMHVRLDMYTYIVNVYCPTVVVLLIVLISFRKSHKTTRFLYNKYRYFCEKPDMLSGIKFSLTYVPLFVQSRILYCILPFDIKSVLFTGVLTLYVFHLQLHLNGLIK